MTKIYFALYISFLLSLNLVSQPLKFTGHRPNNDYDEYLHFKKLLCKGDSIIGFNEDFYALSLNKGKDWKSFDYKGKIFLDDGTNPEAIPENIFLKGNDIIIFSWGRFFISRNFGQTFERISKNKTLARKSELGENLSVYNGFVYNDSYVILAEEGLYYSKDCNTWEKLNTPEGIQITKFTSNNNEMYIATLKNIYKSVDNGISWNKIDFIVFKIDVNNMRNAGGISEIKAFDNKLYINFSSNSKAFIYVYDLINKTETKLENINTTFLKNDILFLLANTKYESVNVRASIIGNGEIYTYKETLIKSDLDLSSLCNADMKDFCGISNFYLNDSYIVLNGEASFSLNNIPIELKPGCISGNCFNGKGTYLFSNGQYIGQFKSSKFDGYGEITFSNGEKYIGDFKNNKYDGYGEITYANGQKYVGEWKDFMQNGKGTYTYPNGKTLNGNWENGILISNTHSQNGQSSNNSNVNQNNSIINSTASDCKDKIIKSKILPSNIEYKSFGFDEDDVAKEICSNSNNSLTEYVNKHGQIVGYCIYYFSLTGKRIKDEIFDSKGRLMQQSLYEYTPNDKAKFMFKLNYLGEITSLRCVETDGMIDANFESPYPISKEKAIFRYNHPDKRSFTDFCQDCRGTGYGNNNLKRCYICNGAGSITHTIIKY